MIDLSARVSRRRILQGMGVFAASTILPISIFPATAATPVNNDFIKISSLLTGKKMLPAGFGAALFSAFTERDHSFPVKMSRLRTCIEKNAISGADLNGKLNADPAFSDLVTLPAMLLTGLEG